MRQNQLPVSNGPEVREMLQKARERSTEKTMVHLARMGVLQGVVLKHFVRKQVQKRLYL